MFQHTSFNTQGRNSQRFFTKRVPFISSLSIFAFFNSSCYSCAAKMSNERRYQSHPLVKLRQKAEIELQRAGIKPRDEMRGHFLPTILRPNERKLVLDKAPRALKEIPEELLIAYVLGLDVSHWEVEPGTGELSQGWWNKRAAEGYKFVFVKILGGSVDPFFKDPQAPNNIYRALQAGFAVGGYVFVNPGSTIVEQVEAAKLYVKDLLPNMKLGMALDLEGQTNVPGAVINEKMQNAIRLIHGDPQLKNAAWVYSNKDFLDQRPVITLADVADMYYRWPASWTTAPDPTMPRIWTEGIWHAWQFTAGLMLDDVQTDGDRMQPEVFDRLKMQRIYIPVVLS